MSPAERDLILALVTSPRRPGLPKDEFLKRFPRQYPDGGQLSVELIREAIESKDAQSVECALIVGFIFGFRAAHLEPLLRLAYEDWHFAHEDTVSALGELGDVRAVEALFHATQWVPSYLGFDDSRALAVKAIWALGELKGPKPDEALHRLAAADNLILRQAALKQVERRRIA